MKLNKSIMKKLLLLLAFVPFSGLNAQGWITQATGFTTPSRGLSEIQIVDANTVWALAYDGTPVVPPATSNPDPQQFTKTTDGGNTWTSGTINVGNTGFSINNISPVSATTAWVSALNPDVGNGVIYKTTNGGTTWTQQNSAAFQVSGSSFINGVHFFDANIGIAFGDPANGEFEIYRTTNGGTTWALVPAANIPNPTTDEWGYNGGNIFIGSNGWLPTNKGRILKTTNMGLNWTVSQAPLTDFSGTTQSGRMAFSSATNGCLLKTANGVDSFYTTTNGGTTWSAASPFTGSHKLLTYIPGTTTIVATSAADPTGSSYSTDNGLTWTIIDSDVQRGVSSFLNGTTGWCAGFNTNATTGGVFKFDGTLSNPSFDAGTVIKVHPNPANNFVTLSSELDSYDLSVTDLTGKVVLQQSLSGIENTINVSNLSSGIYLFNINSDDKKDTIKVIKN